jgi:hypothetical protein
MAVDSYGVEECVLLSFDDFPSSTLLRSLDESTSSFERCKRLRRYKCESRGRFRGQQPSASQRAPTFLRQQEDHTAPFTSSDVGRAGRDRVGSRCVCQRGVKLCVPFSSFSFFSLLSSILQQPAPSPFPSGGQHPHHSNASHDSQSRLPRNLTSLLLNPPSFLLSSSPSCLNGV